MGITPLEAQVDAFCLEILTIVAKNGQLALDGKKKAYIWQEDGTDNKPATLGGRFSLKLNTAEVGSTHWSQK